METKEHTMKHIQDLLALLNYLDVERTQVYHLEVRDHDSGIWTAAIKDADGFLAENTATEEFVYQQGDTMIHAIYALDAQCAAMLERIEAT
jgi:hypothetical protein